MSIWLNKLIRKKLTMDREKSAIETYQEMLRKEEKPEKLANTMQEEFNKQHQAGFDDMIQRQKEGAKIFAEEMNKAAKEISKKRPACCNSITTPDLDNDQVNNPSHYQSMTGGLNIDCITAMRAAFGDDVVTDFCICNAFKYIWRHQSKNGKQDIEKAIWYLNKYLELDK